MSYLDLALTDRKRRLCIINMLCIQPKLLCCTLNGEFHSKWKDHEPEILCQGCITDLLEKEYGDLEGHDFTNLILQDFKWLHPTSDCNGTCEEPKELTLAKPLTADYIKYKKSQINSNE